MTFLLNRSWNSWLIHMDEGWFTRVMCLLSSELWCLSGGKRGDYQDCFVLYCILVLKWCTVIVISTLTWAVFIVLWIGFCHAGPISLCVDSFVFVFFVMLHMLYYCNTMNWTWWDWSLILGTFSFFSAMTLLIGSLDLMGLKPNPWDLFFLQCYDTVDWLIWPIKTHPWI